MGADARRATTEGGAGERLTAALGGARRRLAHGPVGRVVRGVRRAVSIARGEGVKVLGVKVLDRSRERLVAATPSLVPRQEIRMLVRYEDALEVDWSRPAPWATSPLVVRERGLNTAWILHPPGESSGGAQNILRFVKYLEDAGHRATIYLYHSADHAIDAPYVGQLIAANPSYPDVAAQFRAYSPTEGVAPGTDAIFATGWETAYPVHRDPSPARRFYFVQDFEPAFYPVGSEHVLAENTYRFGFHGITAGGWLSEKLARDYGMRTSHFGFAADLRHYSFDRTEPARDVFFYARPVTTRRGFELGVMALQIFARQHPDRTIRLAGWDVSGYDLPFRYVDHGTMKITELNDVYNRCAVALVLSLTNMSLLPLELLSSGVIPVLNHGENNTKVVQNEHIRYADPSPHALAAALAEEMTRPDLHEYARKASASVAGLSWDESGRQFVDIVVEAMRG
ncbi:rhamnosyltransferase WsaF family glycosyltransferase [Geodermatophilus sp. SYSU D00815]